MIADSDSCEAVFGAGGQLNRVIPGFEERAEQRRMAEEVLEVFSSGEVALLEAGTGTGKSLAYLYPAILKALSEQKRTVISTHTINLQQQLLEKDIPLLLRALGAEVKVVLVKGMHNYVCLRRLHESLEELPRLKADEAEQLQALKFWADETADATRASLDFSVSPPIWEQSCVEGGTCTHMRCPHRDRCRFLKDRAATLDAQVLIVNHNLLFADLQMKEQSGEEAGILPSFDYLVIDEAHHLEEVATESLAMRVSRRGLVRLCGQLLKEQRAAPASGKLSLLQQKLAPLLKEEPVASDLEALADRLEVSLPMELRRLVAATNELFEKLALFVERSGGEEQRLRLREEHLQKPMWQEEVVPDIESLVAALRGLVQSLDALDHAFLSLNDELLRERSRGLRKDIQAIGARLEGAAAALEHCACSELAPDEVRWVELQTRRGFQLEMVSASLDVSRRLAESLYSQLESVIFVSATLTTQGDFSYARRGLGLTDELLGGRPLREATFDSPFAYETQALFVVPTDLPSPRDPRFFEECCDCIWELIGASRGNAFVLFTSYQMLRACHDSLRERCEEARWAPLLQGSRDRQSLLDRFRETEGAVLFGTSSFWEGVDVVGDALRCVILVKLPFRVPTEPIVEARLERMVQSGENAFMRYTVPSAIVKFKQGFGRLVRKRSDRGCVACLDTRLVQKPYGRLFLKSLPPCRQVVDCQDAVLGEMRKFFGV